MIKFIKKSSVKQGFKNAFAGLFWAFQSQINFKIHSFFMVFSIALGIFFKISYQEWLIVISTIATVLVLELINTSIEQTTDAVAKNEFNPVIKRAKDVSAAAVLIYALYAIIIGAVIFGGIIL